MVNPCAQALAVAERLVADGRLWQARRALNGCQAGGSSQQIKLAEIDNALGMHRVVSAPLAAAAITAAVLQIEQAIRGGSCEQALTDATQLYDRASPNPDAALLAGQAASCLGRKPEAKRWYARAMLELDNAQTPASWRTLPVPRELRWLTSRSARLDTWAGHVTLTRDDDKAWIARQDERFALGEPLCHAGEAVVIIKPDSLYVSKLPSYEQLWYLSVADNAHVLQTLGDQLLVVEPTDAGFTIKRVDCATGRVLAKGNAKAQLTLGGRHLVASRYTDWAIVEDERASRTLGYLFIDGKLHARRFEIPFACAPLTTWSSHEYLSGCGDARRLFAVDFTSLEPRPLAALPEGFQLDRASSVVPELASLSGNGLLLLRGNASGAEVKVIAPLTSSSWQADWSPDGQRFGGVASDDNGRALALIWNVKQERVELDWPGYSATTPHHSYGKSPGSAIRVASSSDRRWLALATADEARSFDLSAGTSYAFGLPPDHAAPAILTDPNGFALVADDASVSLWRPGAAPTLAPQVQLSAPGWLSYSGGPWLVGQAPGLRGLVALNPRTGTSIQIQGAVRGFSPDGTHLAYQVDSDTLGLAKLDASTLTVPEVWRRGAGAGQSSVVFSRDSRTLFFSEGALRAPRVWQQLVLSSLEVRPEARDLSQAVDFDATGQRWVTRDGELRVASEAPRQLEGWNGRHLGADPRFMADDRLVAANGLDGAWLWSASDRSLLGELIPLARGGVLFTPQPLPDQEEQGSTELVELIGARASERLTCLIKKRLYPWEICADRFEQPGLLADRLANLR